MSLIRLQRPIDNEICPVGFHVVRRHRRVCQSGSKIWVEAHIAKNRAAAEKSILPENLKYSYWNADLSKYKPLHSISGFDSHHEIDALIQYWLEYWQLHNLDFPENIDPLMIKSMIAVASSFDPNASSSDGTRVGLMLVPNEALVDFSIQALRGVPKAKQKEIAVSLEDLVDPVVNIAIGCRWASVKFSTLQTTEKTIYNMLKAYRRWHSQGDVFAARVIAYYNKSR